MNILFICRYNRFRSRIAAAYFKKINKNKSIKVDSAGLIKGNPVDRIQKKFSRDLGVDISGKPKGLSTKLIQWQDMIVNVADDVPKATFKDNRKYGKKMISWRIKDTGNDEAKVKRLVRKIMRKVDKLAKRLENVK